MKGPALRLAVDARVLGQRGVGRYLANLLRALAGRRDDFRCLLALGVRSDPALVPRDPRFETATLRAHPALVEQLLLPRLARRWGAQVLHYPDNTGALRPGLPMVLTLHDALWLRPLAEAIAKPSPRQRLQDVYRKWICPRAAGAAALVLTISRHSEARLRQALALPPGKLARVAEGLDPAFRRRAGEPEARRRRRALGIAQPYVLASGAADRRKNIDRLIRAFGLARRRDARLAKAQLLVTSLRPGEAAATTYAATARASGVAAAVRFLPYVSDADLKALYQGALCFAYPSLEEGFGLPLLEAFSLGCPALAARAGSLPEVAGPAAVYADPLDEADLARGLAAACGARGRQALRRGAAAALARWTWERSAAEHLRAWRQAAGAR